LPASDTRGSQATENGPAKATGGQEGDDESVTTADSQQRFKDTKEKIEAVALSLRTKAKIIITL
jgi:hypothetical protein